MKDAFVNMMVSMMPMMKPFMWFAAAVAILGLVLTVSNLAFKTEMRKGVVWSGRLVLTAAIFFLAAQAAGVVLNMPPTINFGDSAKFQFILVSFWQIGIVFLVAGLFIRYLGTLRLQKLAQQA